MTRVSLFKGLGQHMKKYGCFIAVAVLVSGGCLLTACRPTGIGLDPREQKIYTIKWSPDGKQLAFTYRSGASSTRTYRIYTIPIDGNSTKILQTKSQEMFYFLLLWPLANKLLIGEDQSIYEMDLTGKEKLLFSLPSDSHATQKISVDSVCSVYKSNHIIINGLSSPPILLDMDAQVPDNYQSVEVEPPHPYSESQSHPGEIRCSPYDQSIYLASFDHDIKNQTSNHIFATAKILPESKKVIDIQTFEPWQFFPSEELGKVTYKFLGWKDESTLVFGFIKLNGDPFSVYEYNMTSKEFKENKDIKVLGEFSPDFQKVAYLSFFDKNQYLTVSRPDGTEVKRLLKVEVLPKGDFPL